MMKKSTLRTVVLVSGLLFGSVAMAGADCQPHPKNEQISKDAFEKALKDKGFMVKKFKVDDNCYELEGKNPQGQKVEMYFDTKTGKVVKSKIDGKKMYHDQQSHDKYESKNYKSDKYEDDKDD